MTNRLGQEKIHSLLWELSIPAILGMVSSAVFNIVDRYFVGKIDPLALSGVGITMPIQILQMAVVLLIGIGASTLISIRLGEGEKQEAEDVLWLSFKYIILTMTIFSILFLLFEKNIWDWLSVSDEVYPFARSYILILIIGSIVGLPGYCLNNSLRSIGRAKITMNAILGSSVLNMVLDPLFIFVFDMGVSGAAIATVISQIVLTIYITWYFIRTKDLDIHLKLRKPERELALLKEIFYKGSPTFYVQILATFMSAYINRSFIEYGSDLEIASLTIISTIFNFYHLILIGIVHGNQPIVGYNWGSRQYDRVCRSLELSVLYASGISLFFFVLVQWRAGFFVSFFTEDPSLIKIASSGMRLYLLAIPLLGAQVIGAQYFQSVGKSKRSSFLLFLRYGFIVVPSIMILAPRMGVKGIYLSNAISDFVASVITIGFVLFEIKELKKLYDEEQRDRK